MIFVSVDWVQKQRVERILARMAVVGFLRAPWENKPPSWRSAWMNATVQCSVDHVPHTHIKMVANYSLSPSPLLENWLARTGWKKMKQVQVVTLLAVITGWRSKRCFHLVLRRWKKKIVPVLKQYTDYCQPWKMYRTSNIDLTEACRSWEKAMTSTGQHYAS